jgi:acyl carrier protein
MNAIGAIPMEIEDQSITQTLERIVRRFAPNAGATAALGAQTHLIDDLGVDSPRMIDIVLDVEDHFGFTIDDQDVQKVRTFGDLVRLVSQCAQH